MKTQLTKIGWHGMKAMIGIEVLEENTFRLMRSQLTAGRLILEEQMFIMSQEDLHQFLYRWPLLPLVVLNTKIQGLEQWVNAGSPNFIADVLGIEIEDRTEFVAEKFEGTEESTWVKVHRKDQLLEGLDFLSPFLPRLLSIHTSQIAVLFLAPSLSSYRPHDIYQLEELETACIWQNGLQERTRDHGRWLNLEELSSNIGIDEEAIPLYAALAFQYTKGRNHLIGWEKLEAYREDLDRKSKWTRILVKGLVGSVIGLAFLIGINIWMEREADQNESIIHAHQVLLDKLKEQQNRLDQQVAFLNQPAIGDFLPGQVSWSIDQICSLANEQLYFDQLLYQPSKKLLKKIDPDLESVESDILIQGSSPEARAFSAYAQALRELPWIRNASIHHSAFNFQTGQHEFVLLINLNHA